MAKLPQETFSAFEDWDKLGIWGRPPLVLCLPSKVKIPEVHCFGPRSSESHAVFKCRKRLLGKLSHEYQILQYFQFVIIAPYSHWNFHSFQHQPSAWDKPEPQPNPRISKISQGRKTTITVRETTGQLEIIPSLQKDAPLSEMLFALTVSPSSLHCFVLWYL